MQGSSSESVNQPVRNATAAQNYPRLLLPARWQALCATLALSLEHTSSVPPPKVFALEPRTYLTLDAQARSPNVDKPSAAVRLPGEQKEGCGETRGSIGCLLECQEISYFGGRVQPGPEAAQMIACVRSSLHRQVCSSVRYVVAAGGAQLCLLAR